MINEGTGSVINFQAMFWFEQRFCDKGDGVVGTRVKDFSSSSSLLPLNLNSSLLIHFKDFTQWKCPGIKFESFELEFSKIVANF